jgi:hypothetical protein
LQSVPCLWCIFIGETLQWVFSFIENILRKILRFSSLTPLSSILAQLVLVSCWSEFWKPKNIITSVTQWGLARSFKSLAEKLLHWAWYHIWHPSQKMESSLHRKYRMIQRQLVWQFLFCKYMYTFQWWKGLVCVMSSLIFHVTLVIF